VARSLAPVLALPLRRHGVNRINGHHSYSRGEQSRPSAPLIARCARGAVACSDPADRIITGGGLITAADRKFILSPQTEVFAGHESKKRSSVAGELFRKLRSAPNRNLSNSKVQILRRSDGRRAALDSSIIQESRQRSAAAVEPSVAGTPCAAHRRCRSRLR
jgi:hypothetical protein